MSNFQYNRRGSGLASELSELRGRANAKYTRDLMEEYAQQNMDTVDALSKRIDASARESKIETILSTGATLAKGGFDYWKTKRKARLKKLKEFEDVPTAEEAEIEDFKKEKNIEGTKVDMGTRVREDELYKKPGLDNYENQPTMVRLDEPKPQEDLSIFDEPEEQEPIDISKAPAPKDYIDNYDQEATGEELFGKPDETELTREDKDFFGDWENDDQEEEAFKNFLNQKPKVEDLGKEFDPLKELYSRTDTGEAQRIGGERPIFGADENVEYLSKPSLIQRFGNKLEDFKGSLQKIKSDVNETYQNIKDSFTADDPFEVMAAQKAENQAVAESTKNFLFSRKSVREPSPEPEEIYDEPEPFEPPPGHDYNKGTYDNPDPAPPEGEVSNYEQQIIDAHRSGNMYAEGSKEYEDFKTMTGQPQEAPQPIVKPEPDEQFITKGGYKIPKFEPDEDALSEFSEAAQTALRKSQDYDPEKLPTPEEGIGEDIGADLGIDAAEEAGIAAGGEAALAVPGVGEVVGGIAAAVGVGTAIYGGVKYLQAHPKFFPDIGSDVGQFGKLISGNQTYHEFQQNLKNPFETEAPTMPTKINTGAPQQTSSDLSGSFVGGGNVGSIQY